MGSSFGCKHFHQKFFQPGTDRTISQRWLQLRSDLQPGEPKFVDSLTAAF